METAGLNAEAFAAEAGTVPVVAESSNNAVVADAPTTKATSKFYTEEDLVKVRSQEKEKLYPQIDKLKEELDSIKKEREAELAARAAEAEAKAKAQQEALESDMDVRTCLRLRKQSGRSSWSVSVKNVNVPSLFWNAKELLLTYRTTVHNV
jgi:septal ring factor EnvC (AmiA/AmiB activator)